MSFDMVKKCAESDGILQFSFKTEYPRETGKSSMTVKKYLEPPYDFVWKRSTNISVY
jgi:hypothetical protein